jgi:Do/DeqQ family serine protease
VICDLKGNASRRGVMVAGAVFCAIGFAVFAKAYGQPVDDPLSAQAPAAFSFAPIVEKTSPAVVNMYAQKIIRARGPRLLPDTSVIWRLFRDSLLFGYGRDRIQNILGSGVIVRPEGIVVTNHHVVEAAEGIAVVLADGRIFEARVLLSDQRTDLAVLRIEVGGESLPFVEFGDSDRIKVGDPILAIGNPFGLEQTVTSGIISALARTGVGISDLRFFIQTDASINPGNSGGALIALDGKLIGINTAIYSASLGAQGLGFAIPSNMVRTVVETAIQNKPLVRAWTGISGRSIPPQLAGLLGLSTPQGVLVTDVYQGSPAEKAGVRQGDVVLQVGDFPVNDPQALRYRIATRMIGETVRLTVQRKGIAVDVPVELAPPPNEPKPDEAQLSRLSPFSGAKMVSLSPAFAEEHGLDSGISGVAILDVEPGSAAQLLGLRVGDIIRAIDNQRVNTVREVEQFKAKLFTSWTLILNRGGENISIQGG